MLAGMKRNKYISLAPEGRGGGGVIYVDVLATAVSPVPQ